MLDKVPRYYPSSSQLLSPKAANENSITRLVYYTSHFIEKISRGWNINHLSIAKYPSAVSLGPPNPWLITIAKETSGFRCRGISSRLRLLMPTFSLLSAPPSVTFRLHCAKNAPLPLPPQLAGLALAKFSIYEFSIFKQIPILKLKN